MALFKKRHQHRFEYAAVNNGKDIFRKCRCGGFKGRDGTIKLPKRVPDDMYVGMRKLYFANPYCK